MAEKKKKKKSCVSSQKLQILYVAMTPITLLGLKGIAGS